MKVKFSDLLKYRVTKHSIYVNNFSWYCPNFAYWSLTVGKKDKRGQRTSFWILYPATLNSNPIQKRWFLGMWFQSLSIFALNFELPRICENNNNINTSWFLEGQECVLSIESIKKCNRFLKLLFWSHWLFINSMLYKCWITRVSFWYF